MSEVSLLDRQRPQNDSEIKRPLNNDSLAHVYLLLGGVVDGHIEERIHTEFITDMGERLENQPFCSTYGFKYENGEIVYDTGILYLESLHNSLEAAAADVQAGTFPRYHLDRQAGFMEQGLAMKQWLGSDDTSHLLFFSLCPEPTELSAGDAKKQSFKPDRQMASIQLHSKNADGTGSTIAFSLDVLTIDRLRMLFSELGIDCSVPNTSLEQLTRSILIDDSHSPEGAVDRIISTYDQLLYEQKGKLYKQGIDVEKNAVEANSFVRKHPEAYWLYRQIIDEVAMSLTGKRVTPVLANIVHTQLVLPYSNKHVAVPRCLMIHAGDYYDYDKASLLVDYLRKKAIPEYLKQKLSPNSKTEASCSSGYSSGSSVGDGASYSIGSAGASAQQSGKTYDGGCPSSSPNQNSQQTNQSGQNEQGNAEQARRLGIKPNAVKYQYHKGYCVVPNCPSSEKDEKVPVGPCSVCRDCQENLYDKGIDAVKYYEPSFLRIMSDMFNAILVGIFNDETEAKDEGKGSSEKPENNVRNIKSAGNHSAEPANKHSNSSIGDHSPVTPKEEA